MSIKLTVPSLPEIRGVVVGGCIDKPRLREAQALGIVTAHCHNNTKDRNFGWICITKDGMTGYQLMDGSGDFDGVVTKPNANVLHEYAHILTPDHGHDRAWMGEMRALGQTVPMHYIRLSRRPKPTGEIIIMERAAAMALFTVNRASNAEMMQRILAFYKPPPARILDSTYGYGSFWNDAQGQLALQDGDGYDLMTMDIRSLPGVQQVADYTKELPFPDASFDVIVYDPPYGGITSERLRQIGYDPESALGDYDVQCLKGDGKLAVSTAKLFFLKLKRDGIVVYKHTHIQDIPHIFMLADYLIQDLGPQADIFKHGENHYARRNHAFWMILKKALH